MQNDFLGNVPAKKVETDSEGRVILSVEECHFLVNEAVSRLGKVKVRGEISKANIVRGAMAFFELKDATGKEFVLECALFNYSFSRFKHLLQDGMEVVVTGKVNLYKSGRLRVIVDVVEPYGEGAWRRALEELKKKLEVKGYFDPSRKRKIPQFVRKIGLITSAEGQAIHDFLQNVGSFGFQIFLYPVWVEGDKAEGSIVGAFEWFNKNRPDMDVLVLVRGGGSFENLKAFHSELIAEAIVASRVPVITGIGHDQDEHIADYAADKFCSTPTAVAVFLRTQREELFRILEKTSGELLMAAEDMLHEKTRDIELSAERLHQRFGGIFESFHKIERAFLQTLHFRETVMQQYRHALQTSAFKGEALFEKSLAAYSQKLQANEASLAALNPEHLLKRGYSVVYTKSGKVLKEAEQAHIGEDVSVKLWKGRLRTRVEKIQK